MVPQKHGKYEQLLIEKFALNVQYKRFGHARWMAGWKMAGQQNTTDYMAPCVTHIDQQAKN